MEPTDDFTAWRLREAKEKAERDKISHLITAKEETSEQIKKQVKEKVIRKGLSLGLDHEMIAQITSVPLTTVKDMVRKTQNPAT